MVNIQYLEMGLTDVIFDDRFCRMRSRDFGYSGSTESESLKIVFRPVAKSEDLSANFTIAKSIANNE